MFLLETRPSIRALPCALPERHARARGGRRARVGRRSLSLGGRVRRELGVQRGRASRGVRAADRFSLRPTRSSRVARAGTRGARRERSRRFSIRGRFGEARVRSARPHTHGPDRERRLVPAVLHAAAFRERSRGTVGSRGRDTRDDHHPHGHAVAHGVKRDASQMMTVEERDERVRKIVSLVKVLLTGACGRDIARVSTRDAPVTDRAGRGSRAADRRFRHAFPIAKKLQSFGAINFDPTFFFSSESPNQPAADGSDELPRCFTLQKNALSQPKKSRKIPSRRGGARGVPRVRGRRARSRRAGLDRHNACHDRGWWFPAQVPRCVRYLVADVAGVSVGRSGRALREVLAVHRARASRRRPRFGALLRRALAVQHGGRRVRHGH